MSLSKPINNHQNTNMNYNEDEKFHELRYILPMFLDDFIEDFAFEDIHHYVNSKDILFTEDELKKIMSMTNEEHQNILIFQILIKNKKFKQFLEILRSDYSWLSERLQNGHISYLEKSKDITEYLNSVHDLRSRIPKHSDNNVRRIKYFAKTRDYLKRLRPWYYVVIYGELGRGKKWLALDTCCDYSVIKSMDYNIFWLDVHNCNSQEKDLEQLQRLKIMLGDNSLTSKIGDYEGISNKILELQQDLKTILKRDEFKDCLLVLSDVQNCKTIDAFFLPCKILVTTRNKKIKDYLPESQTKIVNINQGLSNLESLELFERVLQQDTKTFPAILHDIFEYSKTHPFLLNIIAQQLKGSSCDKWDIWKSNLEHFRIKNDRINTVIEMSLRVLKPKELELFHTLSIFHHSVKIPVSVLALFWDKDEKETEALINKFDKYSLVNKFSLHGSNTNVACLIHILYYNYLKNCVNYDRTAKKHLNKRLVESYKIEDVLRSRTEVNLDIPDDHYFYYYIGYHLKEAEMTHLFPKLYLDFGFLGQKLRATGLPNTIGDLKYFKTDIIGLDYKRRKLLECLHEFLPNIEEMIFKSNDTYLIQYALMASGEIYSEAVKQAKEFRHRVWFSDSDHFHRRRQIVPLREKPKLVKLIDSNTCLVALENHNILVADLSLNYSSKPTCFVDHNQDILKIVLFTRNHCLAHDLSGNIRIWSIEKERQESLNRQGSIRFVVNQIDYSSCLKVRQRKSLQLIRENSGYIQCFFVQTDENNEILLHTVLSNGLIQIYKWNDIRHKFESENFPAFQTRTINVKFILRTMHIYMILTKSGEVKFFNVRDESRCGFEFIWPENLRNPINLHNYTMGDFIVVIFVFANKVFQIKFPLAQKTNTLLGTAEDIYEINENECITSSVLSDDGKYLIVGTKQGILVLDVKDKTEILRNSISDHITCVDIYSLDDAVYKYIIISGSKNEKQLNIFGLKRNGNQSLTWANSIGTFVNECKLNLRFEPTAWLIGKQLFDVILDDTKTVVAVDSKNRIHHLLNDKWSMILPENTRKKITIVKIIGNEYYYGSQNGFIYGSNINPFDSELNEPIKFLKLFDEDFFVASSLHKSVAKRGSIVVHLGKPVAECYLLENDYLLYININCSIGIRDASDGFETREYLMNDMNNDHVGGIDFKESTLVVSGQNRVYIYNINVSNAIEIGEKQYICDNDYDITAIQISSDVDLCAVGFSNGLIEIYKIEKWQLIQRLESHSTKIFDMKFSPWPSANLPIILVSISEQICFWNITHVLNNPLPVLNRSDRSSARFNSNRRTTPEPIVANINNGYDVTDSPIIHKNFWSNKRGSMDKPELLSCIKFAGNAAEKLYSNEQFTEFVTIDDEGEIYFFKSNELSSTIERDYSNGNVQK